MPCISFIVPVYNMERLLPRALRSLRAQTLTDFEAILINDGSKDGSAALCAQAAAEDARFRFIDQPNGGVAAARNAGLDAARGEYVFFLDPDDWVEPDAAEVLYHAARNADADCVEFGLYLDSYDENDRLLHTQTSGSTLSGVYRGAPFKEHFDETASSYLVTNKLFRRAGFGRQGDRHQRKHDRRRRRWQQGSHRQPRRTDPQADGNLDFGLR